MVTDSSIKHAMGAAPGDELTIENQWAKVIIKRGENKRHLMIVFGDCETREFGDPSAAMLYALNSLSDYAEGAFR